MILRLRIFSKHIYSLLKVKLNIKNCPSQIIIFRKKNILASRAHNRNKSFLILKSQSKRLHRDKSLFSSVKESQQDSGKRAINVLEFLKSSEELQQILSRVKEFEAEPDKNGLKTFQMLSVNIIPVWLLSEKKRIWVRIAMENNIEKIKEEMPTD